MPEKIIYNDGSIRNDEWQLITSDKGLSPTELPKGNLILPADFWLASQSALEQQNRQQGIWLGSDIQLEDIANQLLKVELIAVNFPVFTDGRGYSTARLLRERYGYAGEIRAIGDVLQDQLCYMRRCGFDSYQLKEGKCIQSAAQALFPFKETYQAAADQPEPIYRRALN